MLLDQALVQAPRRGVAHHDGQHFHGRKVGVRRGRAVVADIEQRRAADAPQGDGALAVLHGVERVELGQLARGLLDHGEVLRHPAQHLVGIELAGNNQRGVVGLVILAVERLQARDVDVLDVGSGADGVFAVVVPVEHRRQRLLVEDAPGAVFAALHFVAHHRHLGVEIFPGNEAVDHGVGMPRQEPLQVVFVGGEAGEVIGAVEPGAAVGAQATLVELRPDVAVGRRALEDEVLEQVGHARLAIIFMA